MYNITQEKEEGKKIKRKQVTRTLNHFSSDSVRLPFQMRAVKSYQSNINRHKKFDATTLKI